MSQRPRSIRKNFGLAFLGSAIYQACQWGMLVLLTKLTSPEEVGQFALGWAIATPISTMAAFNLRMVQVTDFKDENTFGDFVSLRILSVGLAILAILGVALSSGYPTDTVLVLLIVGLNQCVGISREVFHSFMQKHERMDYMAISQVLAGILSLVALGVVVSLTGSLVLGLSAMLGARLITFLAWDVYGVRSIYAVIRQPGSGPMIRLNWSMSILGKLAWLAFPAALMSVMARFVTVIPQYFIEGMLGTRMLGFYAALAALPLFGQMAVRAAGSAALPRLSRMYANGDRGFSKLTAKLGLVGLVIGLTGIAIAMWGGKPLISALFTPEYAAYESLFVWLMVYGAVSYTAAGIGYSLHATRWFWIQPAIFVVVLSLIVMMCWLWIPMYGLDGAAMAMVVGRLAQISLATGVILWACAKRPAPDSSYADAGSQFARLKVRRAVFQNRIQD